MIEINLLPDELKKKQKQAPAISFQKDGLGGFPVLKPVGIVFAGVFAFHMLLFFIGIYANMSLANLEKKYEEALPKSKEAKTLKSRAETIDKKVRAIDELMLRAFSWSKKLSDLSDSLPTGIWITELIYDERMAQGRPLRYLNISGIASSMGDGGDAALVGKFIKSLEANGGFYSDFSDIELGTIKRDRIDEQEVMNFGITCQFRE